MIAGFFKAIGKYFYYIFAFMVDPDKVIAQEVDDDIEDVKEYKKQHDVD